MRVSRLVARGMRYLGQAVAQTASKDDVPMPEWKLDAQQDGTHMPTCSFTDVCFGPGAAVAFGFQLSLLKFPNPNVDLAGLRPHLTPDMI